HHDAPGELLPRGLGAHEVEPGRQPARIERQARGRHLRAAVVEALSEAVPFLKVIMSFSGGKPIVDKPLNEIDHEFGHDHDKPEGEGQE
ncbi:MAG: hypothetical protein AAB425_04915, partial [Bdellovibrionota bacterium]